MVKRIFLNANFQIKKATSKKFIACAIRRGKSTPNFSMMPAGISVKLASMIIVKVPV
jgi:hypothetical protein